jgi:hypothetical protein
MPLRFTIRDLLWLMALVAMGFGWWVDRTKLAIHDEQASRQAIKYDSLLGVQAALDTAMALHRRLENDPNTTEFEMKKCERDIEACKNSIEFLSHNDRSAPF